MKNKTVKMVLAVVVLGVCCGAYAGVKTYVAHQEQKESEEDSEESTTVFTASTDNIKSLDFMVDDTETTFEKDDDSWVKKDETDFPVNQTTLDSAASAIASVDSDRVLEDVDDLSEYGLDSPSNTIKIVTKSDEEDGDDITTTLYVGDENSSTSQYYVRKDDDEKTVYLIDSSCVEPFTKSLNDYAQMEDFPAISNTDTITKISVDGDNSYELSKDEDTSTWSVKGSEDEEKADSATVSSLVSSFGSMAYSSLADYKCDDKSKYGLDKPYATITVDYQEEVTDDDTDEDTQDDTTASGEAEEMDFWTGEEFRRFIDSVMNKRLSYMAFMTLYWTGMRLGELLALNPKDVDLEKRTIAITKSYQRLGKKDVITPPKTSKSKRVVTIPEFLAADIKDYMDSLYDLQEDDRMFPITKYYLEHEMQRGIKESGVKRIRVHDLRHSHASMLIELGFSPLEIANRLGHEKVETTLNTYAHLYPNKQTKLAERLDSEYREDL